MTARRRTNEFLRRSARNGELGSPLDCQPRLSAVPALPKPAYRRIGRRADAPVSGTALHAARITRPLNRVHQWIQCRAHDFAQMPPPLFSRLHDRLRFSQSNNAASSYTVPLACVSKKSAPACRNLATAAVVARFCALRLTGERPSRAACERAIVRTPAETNPAEAEPHGYAVDL